MKSGLVSFLLPRSLASTTASTSFFFSSAVVGNPFRSFSTECDLFFSPFWAPGPRFSVLEAFRPSYEAAFLYDCAAY